VPAATPDPAGEATPAARYAARRDRFREQERRLSAVSLRISIARGATFAAFLGCLLWDLALASAPAPDRRPLVGAAAALAAFVALAVVHELRLRRLRRVEELRRINEEGLARLARDWEQLPLVAEPPRDRALPLARDLDLFGRASLFHLLGTAHTPAAKALLRDWLQGAAAPSPAVIAARQAAVSELAELLDFRQGLELETRGMERHPPDCEPFLRWAEDEPWLLRRPWLLWAARGATALFVAATVLWKAADWPAALPLALLICNLGIGYAFQLRLGPLLSKVGARRDEILRYVAAMRHAASQPFAAPLLRQLAAVLAPDGSGGPQAPRPSQAPPPARLARPAHVELAVLEGRLGLADVRHSAPLHFVLQATLLWDVHVLALLEAWQLGAGRRARHWLTALGEIETLAAFAALRGDNPHWALPQVVEGEPAFAARGLGHPLLPPAGRVGNDVTVGPAGTFLLVTGSNMSGKSTLLRAIGLNALLAQAGAPVCAAALRLPPLRLATSILVEDSLASGVSFFLAELLRIKQVVAAADDARRQGAVLLYLLDEVLRGTNSAERQIAVRQVLRHLLARGAIGAVSTHDLQLAGGGAPEIAGAACLVHFRETLDGAPGGPLMSFDYRLRPGPATTTNALALLRQVGLDFQEGPQDAEGAAAGSEDDAPRRR
jgi:hypothetical protein